MALRAEIKSPASQLSTSPFSPLSPSLSITGISQSLPPGPVPSHLPLNSLASPAGPKTPTEADSATHLYSALAAPRPHGCPRDTPQASGMGHQVVKVRSGAVTAGPVLPLRGMSRHREIATF